MGLPEPSQAAPQAPPVPGPSGGAPVLPPVAAALPSAPPPIVVEEIDSDDGVQTLAVPFRAGSSETYLPMVSTDESWSTDAEFRFVYFYLILFYFILFNFTLELFSSFLHLFVSINL